MSEVFLGHPLKHSATGRPPVFCVRAVASLVLHVTPSGGGPHTRYIGTALSGYIWFTMPEIATVLKTEPRVSPYRRAMNRNQKRVLLVGGVLTMLSLIAAMWTSATILAILTGVAWWWLASRGRKPENAVVKSVRCAKCGAIGEPHWAKCSRCGAAEWR